ncbi:hypothetical protein KIN20_001803 [Parelaphostrongylus tenuis]|uniref:Uncharacterized protein n=1 Tax=Parelaphostrongylus tenuis TaxID=148309 RepID=A0AAD5LWR9_PARTN|nr:hypothetical protein KIN20_001803 [Parelaphostrongylus tenuis]
MPSLDFSVHVYTRKHENTEILLLKYGKSIDRLSEQINVPTSTQQTKHLFKESAYRISTRTSVAPLSSAEPPKPSRAAKRAQVE